MIAPPLPTPDRAGPGTIGPVASCSRRPEPDDLDPLRKRAPPLSGRRSLFLINRKAEQVPREGAILSGIRPDRPDQNERNRFDAAPNQAAPDRCHPDLIASWASSRKTVQATEAPGHRP